MDRQGEESDGGTGAGIPRERGEAGRHAAPSFARSLFAQAGAEGVLLLHG